MVRLEALKHTLENVLALPTDAIVWLLQLWQVAQFFDDVADNTPINRDEFNLALWNCLIGLNENPFYKQNSNFLMPLVATAIMKWQGADSAEKAGHIDEKTFVWRSSYYDIVMGVVTLCKGMVFATQHAHIVMAMYGEKFEEYKKEFEHA